MRIIDLSFTPNVSAMKQKRDIHGLAKALQYQKKPAVRVEAARALGMLREDSCKPELYHCLNDEDENVRAAAAEALNAIDQPIGVRALTHRRREMRVFISSTFRDMQKERDILIRQVFPSVRQLCRARGVGFTEVDLRWGVTEQQAERGEVLPVCMAEIENSRPYFIGLLGERYSSLPHKIATGLVEEQPWLNEHHDASITEIEILHGVLNHPEETSRALFYFRDPAYIDRLAPAERPNYVSEDLASKEKLQLLKDRIRISQLPLVENYPDPSVLGKLIQTDLETAVEEDFPFLSLDQLDLETANQESFAETRRKVYIRPTDIFTNINQIESSRVPLVLTGDSGMGKSAVLANWVEEYRALHPDTFVLSHFIGATAQSTSYIAIQRRLMAELKRRFQIDRELPTDPKEIIKAFPDLLRLAAECGTVVFVLDGLNQLEDRDNAPDLVWLPETFPPSIKMVLSTLPGRSLEAAQKRGWQVIEVKGLETAERKRMIYSYLAQYRKRLSNRQVDEIVATKQTSNPLFLKAVLDELRIFGIYEKLDERIRYYLQSETVTILYQRILERLEQDYTFVDGRTGLVKEAMSLLWAARDGLNEDELLKLLGQNSELLPRAVWSPLYLSIQDSLVSRAGILAFFHNYLKEAVQQRYLPLLEDQKGAHHRLGEFFDAQPVEERQIRELPWQWRQAEEWPRLYSLLENLDFFSSAWQSNQYEVRSYWTAIEANSGISSLDAYRSVLEAPEKQMSVVLEISFLMADLDHMHEAILLSEFMVDYYRKEGQKELLVGALSNLEILFQQQGKYKEANLLAQEAARLVQEGAASIQNQIVNENNKAATLEVEGNTSGALVAWENLAVFCRENECFAELPAILNNIGKAHTALGNWDTALERYRESEQLSLAANNSATLIIALSGQANVLGCWSRNDEAFQLNQKAAKLCRELGDKRLLHGILSGQVVLCIGTGNQAEAYPLVVEQEQIARELGDQEGLASTLMQRGLIEQSLGNVDMALVKLRESEQISRQIGSNGVLHGAIANQATILRKQGHLQEALRMQIEVEQICRELGDLRALQTSLGNQGNIRFDMHDLEGALELFNQKVTICRQIGFVSGLALGLACQGIVFLEMGRHQEALACADEATPIAQQYHLTAIQNQIQQIYQASGR